MSLITLDIYLMNMEGIQNISSGRPRGLNTIFNYATRYNIYIDLFLY